MECGDTAHFIISIWIQTWIWIQSVDLHGVWRHYIISIWIQIWIWIWSTNLHGVCFESNTVDHHSETNLSLRTGVFRCSSTPVLNCYLHVDSNRKYIWILHAQRKIVVTILYRLSVLSNKNMGTDGVYH